MGYFQLTERDYTGTVAEGVSIDELELSKGVFIETAMQADFTFDGDNWYANDVWLKSYQRQQAAVGYKFIDHWTMITRETAPVLVEAAERWADKNLSPEDYQ